MNDITKTGELTDDQDCVEKLLKRLGDERKFRKAFEVVVNNYLKGIIPMWLMLATWKELKAQYLGSKKESESERNAN